MDLKEVMAINLRRIRHDKQLTQEELAHQAGINRNYVGQIEREEKSPTVDVVEKLSCSLEVSPSDLLSRTVRK